MKKRLCFLTALSFGFKILMLLLVLGRTAEASGCYESVAFTGNPASQRFDYGGISLDKVAEVLAEGRMFSGASYDEQSGQIILFSENEIGLPPLDKDDLAVAIRAIFEYQENPGVSIGTDGEDAQGQLIVRYDGGTANTKFGQLMFEADLLLKWLGFGMDNDLTDEYLYAPLAETVIPDHKTSLEHSRDIGSVNFDSVSHGWTNRIWLAPKEVRLVPNEDGTAFVFDEVSIDVMTESTLLGNIFSDPASENEAQFLRDNWEQYAEAYPQFRDVERLARIVGIVKWIYDSGIPLDLGYLAEYEPIYEQTEELVAQKTVSDTYPIRRMYYSDGTYEEVNVLFSHTITGGVSYSTLNTYENEDEPANALSSAAIAARQALPEGDNLLEWTFNGGEIQANAISTCRKGQAGGFSFSQTDLNFPVVGDFSLSFSRHYTSFLEEDNEFMGSGWRYSPIQLQFPLPKRSLAVKKDDGSEVPGEWYPKIHLINNSGGFQVVYELIGFNDSVEPVYRPTLESSGHYDRLLLTETPSGGFKLEDPNSQFKYEWDQSGLLISRSDNFGHATSYNYDQVNQNRLIRIESGKNESLRQIHLNYNAQNNRLQSVEGPYASGHVENIIVSYGYSSAGNLDQVMSPISEDLLFVYNEENSKIEEVYKVVGGEAVKVLANEEYDNYGRSTGTALYPDSPSVLDAEREFDVMQGLDAQEDSSGSSGSREVDAINRPTQITDAQGNEIVFEYENEFGPNLIRNRRGFETTFAYDTLGMITAATDPLGRSAQVIYAPDSSQVSVSYITDPNGNYVAIKYFTYEDDRLKSIYHNVFNLELSGNQFNIEYTDQPKTEFHYDDNGQLVGFTNPRGDTTTFDRINNNNGVIDRWQSPSGLTTEIESFDTFAHPTRVRTPSNSVLNYDFTDGNGELNYALQSIALGESGEQELVSFDYGENQRVVTVPKDNRGSVSNSFNYNERGGLLRVDAADGQQTHYSYYSHGGIKSVELPGGSKRNYLYDQSRRLEQVTYSSGSSNSSEGDSNDTGLIVVSPTAVEFGTTQVGQQSLQPVKVYNMGSVPLRITSIEFDQPDLFGSSSQVPLIVTPETFIDLNLVYTPDSAIVNEGILVLKSENSQHAVLEIPLMGNGTNIANDPPEPVTGLKANADDQRIVLSWDEYTNFQGDFDRFLIYRSDAPINSGNIDALSPIVTLSNVNTTGYSDNGLVNGNDYYYAVLVVDTYSNVSPVEADNTLGPVVPLRRGAKLLHDDSVLDFGSLAIDSFSNASYTITNDGDKDLRLVRGYLDDGVCFAINNLLSGPFTLAPGESFVFDVEFRSLYPGIVQGVFRFQTNDPDNLFIEKVFQGEGLTNGVLRTVSKTGPADFNTIQSAVNASSRGDVIRILDSSVYQESNLNILYGQDWLFFLTLEASEGELPVIEFQSERGLVIQDVYGVRIEGIRFENCETGIWMASSQSAYTTGAYITNCEFENNSFAGVIHIGQSPTTVINKNIFNNNGYAGVVFSNPSNYELCGGFIVNNTISNHVYSPIDPSLRGKGIQIENSALGKVNHNIISENGIGVHISYASSASSVVDNLIEKSVSEANGYGYGIRVNHSGEEENPIAIALNTLLENEDRAIDIYQANVRIEANTIDDKNILPESAEFPNVLASCGICIFDNSTYVLESNAIFHHEYGIYANNSLGLIFNNILLRQGNHRGAGDLRPFAGEGEEPTAIEIDTSSGKTELHNNTIALSHGSGIAINDCSEDVFIANNIIAYNNAITGGVDIEVKSGPTPSIVNTNYLGLADPAYIGTDGNFSGAIDFVNLSREDVRLQESSGGYEAGSLGFFPTPDYEFPITNDFFGNNRIMGSGIDVGAIETVPRIAYPNIKVSGDFEQWTLLPKPDKFFDFYIDLADGSMRVGESYSTTLTISNAGTVDLLLESVAFSSPELSTLTVFPINISPGNDYSLTIYYSPAAELSPDERVLDVVLNSNSFYNPTLLGGVQVGTSEPPPPVTGLVAQAQPSDIALNWDDYLPVAPGDFNTFRIYRSADAFSQGIDGASSTELVQLTDASMTEYVDLSVDVGTQYYYAVIPTDNYGNQATEAGEYLIVGPAAANTLPVVSQVTAVQHPENGTVTVNYDLSDSDGNAIEIWFEYHDGAAWQRASSVSGDVGSVLPGTGLAATWNARLDTELDINSQIAVYVRESVNPSGTGYAESTFFDLDTLPPGKPTITNNVVSPTNAASQNVEGQREANSALYLNGVEIIDAGPTTAWNYSVSLAEGENVLAFSLVDDFGNQGEAVDLAIIRDTAAPGGPIVNPVTSPVAASAQNVLGTKPNDTGLLVAQWDSNSGLWGNLEQIVPNPTSGAVVDNYISWLATLPLDEGINRFKVQTRDEAGNLNAVPVIVEIERDTVAPNPPAINPLETPYSSPGNVNPIEITGTKEPNTSLWINGKQVLANSSDTEWSLFRVLFEGDNVLSFTTRDLAGNESLAIDQTYVLDSFGDEVTGLTAVQEGHSVRLGWDQVPNLQADFAAYVIYRSEEPFNSTSGMTAYDFVEDLNTVTYLDANVSPETEYHYGIISIDDLGNKTPDPIVTTSILLNSWQQTILRYVIENDLIPTSTSYDLYLSPAQITVNAPAGTHAYRGSVISNETEYFWAIHFTPSSAAISLDTGWLAYMHSSGQNNDELSPLEVMALANKDYSTVVEFHLLHDTIGNIFKSVTHSNLSANVELSKTTDGVNWQLLFQSSGLTTSSSYEEVNPIIESNTLYRISVTIP